MSLTAYVAGTGVPVAPAADGTVTLVANTTYYLPLVSAHLPPSEVALESTFLTWDAAIVAVVTLETTGFATSGPGPVVSDYDNGTTPPKWVQQNPTTAYVPISPLSPTPAATVANLTLTIPGTTSGCAEITVGNFGSRRGRYKIVVGATGGVMCFAPHAKLTSGA